MNGKPYFADFPDTWASSLILQWLVPSVYAAELIQWFRQSGS